MYCKLKENLCLRGWDLLPWAVVKRPRNDVSFIRDKDEFAALELCNGLIDLDGALIPQKQKDIIKMALERGIVEECEYGNTITEDQKYKKYPNRYIRCAHWSITGKCNYRCKHCYMSAPEAKFGEIDSETLMDWLRQIDEAGILKISITGGEPLIRKDFWEFIDEIVKRKIYITQIYSNGALVNEKLLDGLAERGLYPEFNMSYDGDEGWHDWLRGISHAGETVIRAFDLCHEKGFPTGAEMCIHKGNMHLLRQSINTLAAHHCRSVKINPVAETELWARYGQDMTITMEELYQLYLDYIPQFFEDGMPIGLQLGGAFMCRKGRPNWFIPLEKYDGSDKCLRQTVCGHARQTLYISAEGRLLPCMSLSSGDIQNDYPLIQEVGLRQGLVNSTYMKLIDTRVEDFLKHTTECGECEYAKICAGGCRASSLTYGGTDIMAPDPACCMLFKEGWAEKFKAAAAAAVSKFCPEVKQTKIDQ